MPQLIGILIPDRVAYRAHTSWNYVSETDEDTCFISTYSTASHGYAQVGWTDGDYHQVVTAHRAAWTYVHGQIPDGMTVDHRPTCDRRCVRIDHLRLLTNLDNARRTSGRDWPIGQCINGHDDSNWRPKGPDRTKGYCAPCRKATANVARDKRRGWGRFKQEVSV